MNKWNITCDVVSNPGFAYYIWRDAPYSEYGYEFLQTDGTIRETCSLGWFRSADEVKQRLAEITQV